MLEILKMKIRQEAELEKLKKQIKHHQVIHYNHNNKQADQAFSRKVKTKAAKRETSTSAYQHISMCKSVQLTGISVFLTYVCISHRNQKAKRTNQKQFKAEIGSTLERELESTTVRGV